MDKMIQVKAFCSMRGRSSRREFLCIVVIAALLILAGALFCFNGVAFPYAVCLLIFSGLLYLFTIPVSIRRLHDCGLSAKYFLLGVAAGLFGILAQYPFQMKWISSVLALAGLFLGIWNMYNLLRPGTEGENDYGASADDGKLSKVWFMKWLLFLIASFLIMTLLFFYTDATETIMERWGIANRKTDVERIVIDDFTSDEKRVELTGEEEIEQFFLLLEEAKGSTRTFDKALPSADGSTYIILVQFADGEEELISVDAQEKSVYFSVPNKGILWLPDDTELLDELDFWTEKGKVNA